MDKGTLKFPEKTKADMRIDSNPLPTPTVTLNVATADLRKLAEPRSLVAFVFLIHDGY